MRSPNFTPEALKQALDANNGDVLKTCVALGCSPATVYNFKRAANYTVPTGQVSPSTTTGSSLILDSGASPEENVPLSPPRQAPALDITDNLDIPCDSRLPVPVANPTWVKREYYRDMATVLDAGQKVCLVGPAGCGKTTAASEYAAEKGLPFLRVSLDNSVAPREMFGRLAVVDLRTVFVESHFLALCQQSKGAVLLLDEFNFVDSQKAAFLHELLDNAVVLVKEARGGRGRVINIPPTVKIILACNPPRPGFGGTQKLNAALGDRFACINVPALTAQEIDSILSRWQVDPTLRQKLTALFSEITRMAVEQNFKLQVSVRGLRRIVDLMDKGFTLRKAVETGLSNAGILVGDSVAQQAISQILTVHGVN